RLPPAPTNPLLVRFGTSLQMWIELHFRSVNAVESESEAQFKQEHSCPSAGQ
ncbi:hypothetical protein M9458_026501, partial [Cirrhinus mrigala]